MADDKKNLYYLEELSDYKVESDDPDVRGWKVKDAEGRDIGKVDNLLVNKEKEKVVYLDVEVDQSILAADHKPYANSAKGEVHEFINKDGEDHLIIPTGLAGINADEKFVYTDRINHRTFAETKRIEKGAAIDRDYELLVLESYNRNRSNPESNEGRVTDNRRQEEVDREPGDGDPRLDKGVTATYHGGKSPTGKQRDFYDRDEFDRRNYRK